MGYQLPNGSSLSLGVQASTSKVNITAATNAAEVVITTASDKASTYTKGSYLVITKCSWPALAGVCARVKAVTTTQITLEGVNTTDQTRFPSGSVTGEIVKLDLTPFPYITQVATSGGDQQTVSFQPIQLDKAVSLNTFKNPIVNTLTMTHDAEDPIRAKLAQVDKTQELVGVIFTNPAGAGGKGETRIYSAKASFQPIPSMEVNQVETVTVSLSLQSDMLIYVGNGG